MELSADGKFIVLLADGKPQKVDTGDGKSEALKVSGEMLLRPADERSYIFDHSWRQLKEKFYVVDLQSVDWTSITRRTRKFSPTSTTTKISPNAERDAREMNASHTGCYYGNKQPNADQTAALGVFVDGAFTGDGLKIAEVVAGGPLDKAASRSQPARHRADRRPAHHRRPRFLPALEPQSGEGDPASLYDPTPTRAGTRRQSRSPGTRKARSSTSVGSTTVALKWTSYPAARSVTYTCGR